MNYQKYIGLPAEASALIESRRSRPDQEEWEIIVEAMKPTASQARSPDAFFDLGQGAKVKVGEPLYLFLNEETKKAKKPDGTAEVRDDGIYVEGKRIEPSRGSPLQPAMKIFQERSGHVVSLSSWRQWHVLRNKRFTPLVELKDPDLARRRGGLLTAIDEDIFATTVTGKPESPEG
jgi:hypothetical protein